MKDIIITMIVWGITLAASAVSIGLYLSSCMTPQEKTFRSKPEFWVCEPLGEDRCLCYASTDRDYYGHGYAFTEKCELVRHLEVGEK